MINCDKGKIAISGVVSDMLTEFSIIVASIKEMLMEDLDEEFADFVIERSMALGLDLANKTTEDLTEIIESLTKEQRQNILAEALKKALSR